ncbi:MAG TPA: hypothetical protein VHL98_01225 [Microvirga sp.]|jgi:hypothetical protein|nr:hypothetical protein [Microvirga sp.]
MDLLLRFLKQSLRENMDELHRSEAERNDARRLVTMDNMPIDLRLV